MNRREFLGASLSWAALAALAKPTNLAAAEGEVPAGGGAGEDPHPEPPLPKANVPNLRVRPKVSEAYFTNPHKGISTFQRFNGDALYPGNRWSERGPTEFPAKKEFAPVKGYLGTSTAYCRWYWDVLEPEQGQYNFELLENALKAAAAAGQSLQVRLMPHGSEPKGRNGLPAWYEKAGGTVQPNGRPLYDEANYIKLWNKFNQSFAQKFDGHGNLDWVDISYVGPWGEGNGEAKAETHDQITDNYVEHWKKTPLIINLSGPQAALGIKKGTGWRVDCFGDCDISRPNTEGVPPGATWCHMYDEYPKMVFLSGATDTWKRRPVVMESCGTPGTWFRAKYDIDFIFEQGLKYHTTCLMPKSTALPAEWLPKFEAFHKKMGYRFVIRQFFFDLEVKAGEAWPISAWIENVGCAPIYKPYNLVYRLTQGATVQHFLSQTNVTRWLPGDAITLDQYKFPAPFQAGKIQIAAALCAPQKNEPRVKFASEGAAEDGWFPIGEVTLKG